MFPWKAELEALSKPWLLILVCRQIIVMEEVVGKEIWVWEGECARKD